MLTFLVTHPVGASPTNPAVSVLEAQGFQNVYQQGDVLILLRYQLPIADWQNTSRMQQPICSGATSPGTPAITTDVREAIQDQCLTSLIRGMATMVTKDDTGTPIAGSDFPRISFGLVGNYFCAPGADPLVCTGPNATSVNFGSALMQACVDGPTTVTPRPEGCLSIHWNASADVASTANILGQAVVSMMNKIEAAMNLQHNTLIANKVITTTGAIFAQEAFPAMPRVTPSYFSVATTSISPGFLPGTPNPLTGLPAQQLIAQNSPTFQSLQKVGAQFGAGAGLIGFAIAFVVGLLVFIGVTARSGISNSAPIGIGAVFLVFLMAGVLGWVPYAIIYSIAVLVMTLGMFRIMREMFG